MQHILIGALLTSSFAQDSISKSWLGILGLLVILCSAAKQHFHTDENAQASEFRVKKLRCLVRHSQDQIAIVESIARTNEDRTKGFVLLLDEITTSFNQIETGELADLPGKVAKDQQAGKP